MKFRGWGTALRSVLAKSDIQAQDWEEVTEQLLLADIGAHWTAQIVARLKQSATNKADLTKELANQLMLALQTTASRELDLSAKPAVIIMVGVNGVGKTTSMGKIGAQLVSSGHKVLFGAADTFRAAAVAQLQTWGERSGIEVVAKEQGADPASVVHETVTKAKAGNFDVVLLDTAGRLHTKSALMDELGKVIKVAQRIAPISEILLVIDATVGQNGLTQAKVFSEVAPITGVVLTKFDGTAKGGIVIAIQQELGVPVKYLGIGEGVMDLVPFDPVWFVDQLLETNL
ncbi:MAG: signal recognition particle-docking protein FtsY [Actinobacteria bacterium]|jgi:fused signal recognition particle receptor|uniref:Unannotated protein n=1 Tax=freshwater metagenome TaxID=449393 RepID=A0A6J6E337_9ZZZZ|nr:signal recognition particle-docking protein FtsY [Actinomycetota bacterium]